MNLSKANVESLKTLLIVGIYISAFSFFALQVRDVCIKYFEKKTTIAISQKTLEAIQIPIMTLCSGYKISQNVSSLNVTFSDIGNPRLFQTATYKLDKDFKIKMVLKQNSMIAHRHLKEGLNTISFEDQLVKVSVTELTSFGKGLCYAIEVNGALRGLSDFVDFRMFYSDNLSNQDTMVGFKAIISNKTAKVALICDAWQGFNGINLDLKTWTKSRVGLALI